MAQRSSARSIRASWMTGYWGAAGSIWASMCRGARPPRSTISRASSAASGRARSSARWRSRTASAVRCPKSASNTAASGAGAGRRVVRPGRGRRSSRPDAVDEDGDRLRARARAGARPRRRRVADLPRRAARAPGRAGRRPDRRTSTRPSRTRTRTGGPPSSAPPGRTAPADAQDARDLERGEADHSAMTPRPTVRSGPLIGASSVTCAATGRDRRRPRGGRVRRRRRAAGLAAASASAISSGRRVRAVVGRRPRRRSRPSAASPGRG